MGDMVIRMVHNVNAANSTIDVCSTCWIDRHSHGEHVPRAICRGRPGMVSILTDDVPERSQLCVDGLP